MKRQTSKYWNLTQEILDSEYLTTPTKIALKARIEKNDGLCFFDANSYDLLSIICDLLIDQDSENRIIEIAGFIDERLQKNESDGWRYDGMPPDRIMYTEGLKAVDAASEQLFQKKFLLLSKQQQKKILSDIQSGNVDGKTWKLINPILFFEEILAETTEVYFSHPWVQTSFHYAGMGDAKGWAKLKLNQEENLEKRMQ